MHAKNFVFPDGKNGEIANKFFHFITPPEVIIEDYSKTNKLIGEDGTAYDNIKIRLYTGDVGSRFPVTLPLSANENV